MHGFSWLRHFRAREGVASRQYARALISDWIRDGNYKYNPISWKIDILGRRITSWISYSEMLKEGADREFLEKYYQLMVIDINKYRSPLDPPLDPASPLPDTLILVPSSTPFGILTVTFSFDCTFPLPLHLLHGSLIISPYPLH